MSMTCPQCGGDVAPALNACPACHALVHAGKLRDLASLADAAVARGEPSLAVEHWNHALGLLPPDSRQYEMVAGRIRDLSRQNDGLKSSWRKIGTGGGAIGGTALLLWKFKAVAIFALTKGKLLLLGLTNATTLLSMLAAFGVYWAAFGWTFAAGLVASIYVHEMGHVAALRRLGIQATAPMFIPGVGAFVRLRGRVFSPIDDARIGLAGPIWGTAAAVASWLVAMAGGGAFWLATAHVAAWLNLFNLLPIWQLDGSRAVHPMTRAQRLLVSLLFAGAYFVTREGLFVLLAIVAGVRALESNHEAKGDWNGMARLAAVVVILAALCTVKAAV
jgi:Zn-dependent protease